MKVGLTSQCVAYTAASAFLWEWFTTKPFVDSGEVRFIGSVYSMSKRKMIPLTSAPWPCWSIAAAASADAAQVKSFLSDLQPYVRQFNSAEAREQDDVDFVVNYFGHRREDVEEWLQTVKWEENLGEVEEKVIKDTLE
jgi:hypothetical protein